jgi:CDP-4-dehydro-6-deoxyglucose reductase, E1
VADMQSRRHRVTEAGPVHDEREIEAVLDVLRGGGLEDLGPRVAEFERRGAALLAKDFGVMVNSGTSALWLAVDLLGCEPGDEVIRQDRGDDRASHEGCARPELVRRGSRLGPDS